MPTRADNYSYAETYAAFVLPYVSLLRPNITASTCGNGVVPAAAALPSISITVSARFMPAHISFQSVFQAQFYQIQGKLSQKFRL